MRRLLPQIEQTRQHEVIRGLDVSGALGYDYGLLVLLSCVIATFGGAG